MVNRRLMQACHRMVEQDTPAVEIINGAVVRVQLLFAEIKGPKNPKKQANGATAAIEANSSILSIEEMDVV